MNDFSEQAKNLGIKIIKLIENGNVSRDLPGIIQNIPAENRKNIINSHFNEHRDFFNWENACRYIKLDNS